MKAPLFSIRWLVAFGTVAAVVFVLAVAAFGVFVFASAVVHRGVTEALRQGPSTSISTLDQDRFLLDQLRDRGDDLSRSREIDFYLYVPKERDANLVARDVRRRGFRCVLRKPLGALSDGTRSDDWLAYASATHVLSVAYLQEVERIFTRETKRFGGTYDGWEIAGPRTSQTR